MKTLVLGLGKELFGDDSAGIQAVRKLKQELGLKAPSQIKILAVEARNLYNYRERLTEEMKKVIEI
jgi:Ni,Fe-hydrogenase maturation factor